MRRRHYLSYRFIYYPVYCDKRCKYYEVVLDSLFYTIIQVSIFFGMEILEGIKTIHHYTYFLILGIILMYNIEYFIPWG